MSARHNGARFGAVSIINHWTIATSIVLHVFGAIKHHVVDKVATLNCMLGRAT